MLVRGDLIPAQQDSARDYQAYAVNNPYWEWKFRVLNAKALSWRGMYDEMLSVLNPELPQPLRNTDLDFQKQGLEGLALARLHRYAEADAKLASVSEKCDSATCSVLAELLADRGYLEIEKGNFRDAQQLFEKVLELARQQHDRFLEARALLQMSYAALQLEFFDESIDWSIKASALAQDLGAQVILSSAQGNLGWARYKTGDLERSLELFVQEEKRAARLGSIESQVVWLTTAGKAYVDQGKFEIAADSYRKALDLATQLNSKETILNAQISLAFLTVLTGSLDQAGQYSDQAIASARADGNRVDELYALLTKGQIAARRGNLEEAEKTFSEVAGDAKVDPSLKWEAQHDLANLYVDRHQTAKAEAQYRATLATFESARSLIHQEDVKLPFLANASSVYEDYIRLLLAAGKTGDALNVADHSRARTLAEGLGQLRKTDSVLPTVLNAQRIAQGTGSVLLYYWLGEKSSCLWAISAKETMLFKLPPAATIDAAVDRYRKTLDGTEDLTEPHNSDGLELYRLLIQPAHAVLGKSTKLIILPSGSLNRLNFETLLVPEPKPHYWIEDVTLSNASSLRLLGESLRVRRTEGAKLLIVGNPVAPSLEYATPAQAGLEMKKISGHFLVQDQRVLAERDASPAAYLSSNPEQFSYIHFVAHGTASRVAPLDSAIILSRNSSEDGTFRLYARDIIRHPLRAELVTISACYGAGARAYSGEGLVGLSWAFLRAGAHNVVGALWDVSDASTPLLMDKMYDELRSGKSPEQALRAAKLSLLHSANSFRKPFYWAPFQLYTGS